MARTTRKRAAPAADERPRHSPSLPGADAALVKVRAVCATLPEAIERPSHGAPAFFIRGNSSSRPPSEAASEASLRGPREGRRDKCFAMFADNHHHDGRLALWCAAPSGFQAMIVDTAPDRYFAPPYVGKGGWVGVRLDRGGAWDEIATVIENAYAAVRSAGASRASSAGRGRRSRGRAAGTASSR